MQQSSEELGLLALDEEALDDVVPFEVVRIFAAEFEAGFRNTMVDLGFAKINAASAVQSSSASTFPKTSEQPHDTLTAEAPIRSHNALR